ILRAAEIALIEVDDAARDAGGVEGADKCARRLADTMFGSRVTDDVHSGRADQRRSAAGHRMRGAERRGTAKVDAGDLHRQRPVVVVDAQFARDETRIRHEAQYGRAIRRQLADIDRHVEWPPLAQRDDTPW